MPSIFLLAGFIQCSSFKLPKPFRGKRSESRRKSRKHSKLSGDGQDAKTAKGKKTPVTTVLSGNLTDSTDSMCSRSSCDSNMTMESVPSLQKATRVASNGALPATIQLMPADTFYFMPMEEEFTDLQCITDDNEWGYFVDMAD